MEIMYADYQQKLSDVQNMDPSTPESIQNLRYQELVDLEKRIRNFQTESQRDLENAQVKLLQPILDKVEGAIDRVAEQYHYDYIFDTRYGTILHQNPSKDVIELVKKELGLEGVPTPDPEAESGEENPIETR